MRAVCSAYLSCLTREDDFGTVDERDVITKLFDALHVVGGEHESRSLGLEGEDLARLADRLALLRGVIGGIVLIAGIIAIPYPGPGWLIVFAGLGILATEFDWAHRLLRFARERYDRFAAWLSRQNIVVKGAFGVGTCLIVLATVWLLGAAAMIGGWFGIHWPWLASPLFG